MHPRLTPVERHGRPAHTSKIRSPQTHLRVLHIPEGRVPPIINNTKERLKIHNTSRMPRVSPRQRYGVHPNTLKASPQQHRPIAHDTRTHTPHPPAQSQDEAHTPLDPQRLRSHTHHRHQPGQPGPPGRSVFLTPQRPKLQHHRQRNAGRQPPRKTHTCTPHWSDCLASRGGARGDHTLPEPTYSVPSTKLLL